MDWTLVSFHIFGGYTLAGARCKDINSLVVSLEMTQLQVLAFPLCLPLSVGAPSPSILWQKTRLGLYQVMLASQESYLQMILFIVVAFQSPILSRADYTVLGIALMSTEIFSLQEWQGRQAFAVTVTNSMIVLSKSLSNGPFSFGSDGFNVS